MHPAPPIYRVLPGSDDTHERVYSSMPRPVGRSNLSSQMPRVCRVFTLFVIPLGFAACESIHTPPIAEQPAGERAVTARRSGVEVVTFTTMQSEPRIARLMLRASPADPASFLGPDAARTLERNGLRLTPVPLGELDTLVAALDDDTTMERRWLAQPTVWTECARARPLAGNQAVTIEGHPVTLGKGQLRLLIRAWTEPDLDTTPPSQSLRIELLPQLEQREQEPFDTRRPSLEEAARGPLLTRLLADLRTKGEHAFVLTGITPGMTWQQLAEHADQDDPQHTTGDNTGDPHTNGDIGTVRALREHDPQPRQPPESRPTPGHLGPDVLTPTTLGQAMLVSHDPDTAHRRMVIVIIPRVAPGLSLSASDSRRHRWF